MKIKIVKTFGHLKAGQIVDRIESTALKLVKLGYAVLDDATETAKELKLDVTKEFKGRTKTK